MITKRIPVWLFVGTFVVAACSILYELLICHSLSLLAANSVRWYSFTIGMYLVSMGTGAFLYDWKLHKCASCSTLGTVEIFLSLAGLVAIPLVQFFHVWTLTHSGSSGESAHTFLTFFFPSLLWAGLIGFLTGLELPLLLKIAREAFPDQPGSVVCGRVLGADYLGSLAGGIAFPLFLLPHFSILEIGLATASVNFTVALILYGFHWKQCRLPHRIATGVLLSSVLVLLILGVVHQNRINQFFLKRYYFYRPIAFGERGFWDSMYAFPEIERHRSPYQSIDIVTGPRPAATDALMDRYTDKWKREPDYPKNTYLFMNRDFQVHTRSEQIYHEYFAHVPILASGLIPKRILILGAGDGILAHELLKYESVESIHLVDLDPVILRLAAKDPTLARMNRYAFHDPRITTQAADALKFLRESSRKYDAIYIDFPPPMDYNLAKLYSVEFYHLVLSKLKPEGYAVADIPGIDLFTAPDPRTGQSRIMKENPWFRMAPTLHAAGFQSIDPYVSNLETNHPGALAFLRSEPVEFPPDIEIPSGKEQEAAESYRRYLLTVFSVELRMGFVLMSGQPNRFTHSPDFKLPVPLYIMNAERATRAFDFHFPDVHGQAPNSIFKPTLPNLPLYHIRRPF